MNSLYESYQSILNRALRQALEQSWSVVAEPVMLNPGLLYARLISLSRSNAFLWTEAGVQMQERSVRRVAAGRAVSRPVVLATVAADIIVGYITLSGRARWLPPLVQARDWQWQHARGARRVLDTATALGGALIKACQFASTRPDLLPASYIRALAPLQDRMPPQPWPVIEQAIRSELGIPIEAVFAEVEEQPIAAASISQVHRARLRDGRVVALKVQYPGIQDLVATDLAVFEQLAKLVARFTDVIKLQPILEYLQATLPLELDFAHEAAAMTTLRTALQHRPDVVIPAVLPELSTSRLIVMEYTEGIKITEREALEQAGIAPEAVAALLNDVYADQMLRRGILHADPHPGNLLVQPGPRLVLLDHGLTVPLTPGLVDSLKKMVHSLASGDFVGLKQALVGAGMKLDEDVDLACLLEMVGVLLGNAEVEGSERVDSTEQSAKPDRGMSAGVQLGKSMGSIPVDLLLVGRTLGLLDGISKQLDPRIDTMAIVAQYAY